KTNCIGGIW
ncbi:hypothetical protein TNIN_249731, partial [Trichonephila inaurata madagascariensis]